jgi:ABC-type glycerol-3-phosphate transport system permease component
MLGWAFSKRAICSFLMGLSSSLPHEFMSAQGASNFGGMSAMSVVSLVPVFLAFLFGQRFLIRGIATTGIK